MKYFPLSALMTVVLGALLAGCGEPDPDSVRITADREQETLRLNEFFAQSWQERITVSPELQAQPGTSASHAWDDPAAEASDERQYQMRLQLAELLKFDYTRLDLAARLSYELFEEESNRRIEQYRWRSHHAMLRQRSGSPATDGVGVWLLPNGDQFYRALVRWYTTADLTPDELHRTGEQEVARTQAAIRALMPALGVDGTLPELLPYLRQRAAAGDAASRPETQVPGPSPEDSLPEFRKHFPATAFTAGRILYARRRADERGSADPSRDCARLIEELKHAVLLVADTGIHAKRWTRERAIQYVTEHAGLPRAAAVEAVEQSIADPGRAAAATAGLLRLIELRERAAAELSERFDSREFDDVLFGNGPLSLNALGRRVNAYVEREQSPSAE